MANKQRGYVKITLDKERNLRYTLNSLAELEDVLGVPLSELENVHMGMKQVRAFLWAGLIHEDKDLTLEKVGDMVDMDNMNEINEKITEAFKAGTAKN